MSTKSRHTLYIHVYIEGIYGFPLVIFYLPESISRAGLFGCYLALHLLFLLGFNGENKTVKTARKH